MYIERFTPESIKIPHYELNGFSDKYRHPLDTFRDLECFAELFSKNWIDTVQETVENAKALYAKIEAAINYRQDLELSVKDQAALDETISFFSDQIKKGPLREGADKYLGHEFTDLKDAQKNGVGMKCDQLCTHFSTNRDGLKHIQQMVNQENQLSARTVRQANFGLR